MWRLLKARVYNTVRDGVVTCSWSEAPAPALGTEFSSVQSLSHVWLCNPMDYSTQDFPVYYQLWEHAHTHVHRVPSIHDYWKNHSFDYTDICRRIVTGWREDLHLNAGVRKAVGEEHENEHGQGRWLVSVAWSFLKYSRDCTKKDRPETRQGGQRTERLNFQGTWWDVKWVTENFFLGWCWLFYKPPFAATDALPQTSLLEKSDFIIRKLIFSTLDQSLSKWKLARVQKHICKGWTWGGWEGSQAEGSEETLNEVVSSNEEQQDVAVCFPVWEV